MKVLVLLCLILMLQATLARPPLTEKSTQNFTKVYLISSCHLDLGFADGLVNIVNRYFDEHFPNAVQTSLELREENLSGERLVFTTHSYLVWLYLNCPIGTGIHCPSEESVNEFINAIKDGDIVWHAFPFNAEPEVYDKLMAEFGIQFTLDISKSLKVFKPNTMSQRDVPGLTRSMIPLLRKHGIKGITVGVNGASMPPAVPSAFKWVDRASNTSIAAMWHPKGYGGQYGIGLDSMVMVPGMTSALAFAIRSDNSGPPPATEVLNNYEKLRALFPNAEIVASSYNEFTEELNANIHLLQEYTEEIGDTWIHGVSSDPWKTQQYREMLRLRSDCLAVGECSLEENRFYNFSIFLLKYGEHTWGKDVKTFLKDFDWNDWSDDMFQFLMFKDNNYYDIVNSWIEQRTWAIDYPLQALEDHPLRRKIEKNIADLYYDGEFPIRDTSYEPVSCTSQFKYGDITLELSQRHMALSSIVDGRGMSDSINYGGGVDDLLGKLVYSMYTQDDMNKFLSQYLVQYTDFAPKDFGKPNLLQPSSITSSPSPEFCWQRTNSGGTKSLLIEGLFEESLIKSYGAPEVVWLEITLPADAETHEEVVMNMTLYIVNKSPCRIPESLSFSFQPNTNSVNTDKMYVEKLGEFVNVLDVIKNGSKHVHSTQEGIQYGGTFPLKAKAWDTNVVTIGGSNVFPTPMETPDVKQGFAFNIFNNLWGTNYIMWYPYRPMDSHGKYRFTVTLPPKAA